MRIHFISGLPRSGSTLLAAILRQNPAMHARMTSPVSEIFVSAMHAMSMSETALFISEEQRKRILRSIVELYYCDLSHRAIVFDTGRVWTAHLASISLLFPDSRIVCCLRSPAWIVDSIERLVQSNPLLMSKMFGPEAGNVYARAEALMKGGFLGAPLHALRQAWYGEGAGRLVAVQYDSLAARPGEVMRRLYEILNAPVFTHKFDAIEYDEAEFDKRVNMPGLHKVKARVETRERRTILPPDLFEQFDRCFWKDPSQNPRNVLVL